MESDSPTLQTSVGDCTGEIKAGTGSGTNAGSRQIEGTGGDDSLAANGGAANCMAGTPRIPSFMATCKDMAGVQVAGVTNTKTNDRKLG